MLNKNTRYRMKFKLLKNKLKKIFKNKKRPKSKIRRQKKDRKGQKERRKIKRRMKSLHLKQTQAVQVKGHKNKNPSLTNKNNKNRKL